MISEQHVRKFCYEDPRLIENYDKAIADTAHIWEIHHRVESIMNCGAEELIAKDCYENRPAHDLIFMTKSEHRKLHHAGKIYSASTRAKMSKSAKGKKLSRECKAKLSAINQGKHLSDQAKAKLSKNGKGRHWYNNGEV